eukprot:610727-Hanusia_phi.AAC.1
MTGTRPKEFLTRYEEVQRNVNRDLCEAFLLLLLLLPDSRVDRYDKNKAKEEEEEDEDWEEER